MNRFANILVVAAFATTGLVGAATAAFAADDAAPTVSVATGDLNLASAKGMGALQARISRAADQVCGGAENRLDLKARVAFNACRNRATTTAMAQVNRKSGEALAVR